MWHQTLTRAFPLCKDTFFFSVHFSLLGYLDYSLALCMFLTAHNFPTLKMQNIFLLLCQLTCL